MKPLEVPHFIAQPSGYWLQDILPILSLISCLPTLAIFWRTKRKLDFALYSAGFVVATCYHVCYMHKDGLAAAELWGLSGDRWRTLDIMVASFCLARTMSHAVGAQHPITLAFPNILFPIFVFDNIYRKHSLKLGHLTIFTLVSMVALKMIVEGVKTFPGFGKNRCLRVVGWASLAFTCFFIPNYLSTYWLWHSLWHVFLGFCYFELYSELENVQLAPKELTQKRD